MSAVAVLALPLVLNSTVQAVLNLTDTWFIGRLSTAATAAIASIHWLALLAIFLIGGVAMGVQTLVAQAFGAGRFRRATRIAWMGMWASVLTIPAFGLTVAFGPAMIRTFGLAPDVEALAIEFWIPRMIGGPLAAALWAAVAFFNGIGRTRIPLAIGDPGPGLERGAERDLHLPLRLGHGGRGLGHDGRRVPRASRSQSA